ncbi:hypothetical protein QJS66_16285 [Kocuria rhizophila]|nr:hypothetical protein QJS66_16285 [Kocuria rhizophila]
MATGRETDSSLFTGLSFYVISAPRTPGWTCGASSTREGQSLDKAQESCVMGVSWVKPWCPPRPSRRSGSLVLPAARAPS